MSRLFSASELAALRRQFLDSVSGEALEALSAGAKAIAEQGVADAAAANEQALEAHAEATAARFIAEGAATPASVDAAVSGLASAASVVQAEADAKAYADGLVAGLATEGYADQAETDAKAYADGLFAAGYTGTVVVQSTNPLNKITLTFANGLVTGAVEEAI